MSKFAGVHLETLSYVVLDSICMYTHLLPSRLAPPHPDDRVTTTPLMAARLAVAGSRRT